MLLKPIQKEQLEKALQKYHEIVNYYTQDGNDSLKLKRERLIVRKGTSRISIPVANFAFFYYDVKLMFAVDFDGQRYFLDYNLSEVESQLDKKLFFRVNPPGHRECKCYPRIQID
jgi:DNA-binding LytR/AlgR family response regulator